MKANSFQLIDLIIFLAPKGVTPHPYPRNTGALRRYPRGMKDFTTFSPLPCPPSILDGGIGDEIYLDPHFTTSLAPR